MSSKDEDLLQYYKNNPDKLNDLINFFTQSPIRYERVLDQAFHFKDKLDFYFEAYEMFGEILEKMQEENKFDKNIIVLYGMVYLAKDLKNLLEAVKEE